MALADLIGRLSADGKITADEVLEVRREVFDQLDVTRDEAEAVVALNEQVAGHCREWDQAFAEIVADIVVNQQVPRGYVDDQQAEWLIALFSRDNIIETRGELNALIHILERAESAPRRLGGFALAQVKEAVLNGEGDLADGGALVRNQITAGEVSLMRRILYAACGDGDIAITRGEAEVLFDLNDAGGAAAVAEWVDLYSKAIAAAVMTVSGYEPVSREDAARREAWLSQPTEGIGSFLGRFFVGFGAAATSEQSLDSILHPKRISEELWEAHNARFDAMAAAAENVTDDEAQWMASRIGRDGRFDAAERALIEFLRKESPVIHPALRALLDAPPADAGPASSDPDFGRRSA